jgi:hypothetical protein
VHPDAVPEQYKEHYNSWEDYKDGLILTQDGMLWLWGELVAFKRLPKLTLAFRHLQA